MKGTFILKLPISSFNLKPVKPKRPANTSTLKVVSRLVYCLAVKTDDGKWKAHVNTRGLPGYPDVFICSFTEKSFNLRGREVVFSTHPNEHGRYTRFIRNYWDTNFSPGNVEDYCTLCPNCVFSGHLVRVNSVVSFDLHSFVEIKAMAEEYLTMINVVKSKENEETK